MVKANKQIQYYIVGNMIWIGEKRCLGKREEDIPLTITKNVQKASFPDPSVKE